MASNELIDPALGNAVTSGKLGRRTPLGSTKFLEIHRRSFLAFSACLLLLIRDNSSAAVRGWVHTFAGVAVNLAAIDAKFGGDGWESNPPRTPQQRPANGFEDRGAAVH